MYTSRICGLEFSEDVWIVSILNTGDKLLGHSVIVVEGVIRTGPGLMNKQLFVGQYDIQAELDEEQKNLVNKTGRIVEVRCFPSNFPPSASDPMGYTRDYSGFSSHSEIADRGLVERMIKSIREDSEKCKRGEHIPYQLVGLKHPIGSKDGGHNCTSWSIEKLAIAGVTINSLSKPSKAVKSCLIL